MSKTIWQKLGSPEIIPSAITLRAYDGRPSSPEGLFQNVPVELGGKTILIDIEVIDAPLNYNILFGHSYMYAMKAVTSSVFRTMMFPHNGKIITIDQVSHYEPNASSNIDNILPFVHTNPDAYLLIEMGPRIFKDPSLLGKYHRAPPLIHPSAQVCVISTNEMTTEDTLPPTEASFTPDVPLVTEYLPQESPGTCSALPIPDLPLPQGHIPVWEIVPQAITQIPFFYPPSGVQSFQVAAMLTLPNMVLAIPVWYLHPPEMVPQPSFHPQTEGILMQIPILTPTIPPTLPLTSTPATAGGRQKRKIPPLHFPHMSNLLAHYVRKKDTPLTNVLLFLSYAVLSSFLKHPFFLPLHQVHPTLLPSHQPHANKIYEPISPVPYAQNMGITLIIAHLAHMSTTHYPQNATHIC
jgi:hypothetical protein